MSPRSSNPISAKERYRILELHKAADRRYRQSPKGKATQKRYRQTEKAKAAIKRYRQTEKVKAMNRKSAKRYYARHPNQNKSEQAVRSAIVQGKLPPLCSVRCHYCGEQAELYHHYIDHEPEHWLDVKPSCIKCHVKIRDNILRKDPYAHSENPDLRTMRSPPRCAVL